MRGLAVTAGALFATAVVVPMIRAQAAAQRPASKSTFAPTPTSTEPQTAPPGNTPASYQTLTKYCTPCHGALHPEAGLSIETLMKDNSVGARAQDWEDIAERLETRKMPPEEAKAFPTDEERAAAVSWIRSTLKAYSQAHAGDPGQVTVRRLTNAEYQYAVRDLTGIDIRVGLDTSNDAVGGEGFLNFGDVQFVHDSSLERYLEAAKIVADHAVIGAGPLEFFTDPGRTGLELSALSRINELYDSRGFRVVSGEGGRPFGLERYGKAFYVAWHYKHRVALGDPLATLRSLAAKEGITGRFAEHIWTVVNKPGALYPTRLMTDRWRKLPSPGSDVPASIAKAREGTTDLYKYLTTWPSWFFARGDLAAGGAGDESPLSFDDESLKALPTTHYAVAIANVPSRRAAAPKASGPVTVHLQMDSVNPSPGVRPVIVWRNPRVVTRAPLPTGASAEEVAKGGAILSSQSLRSLLSAEAAAARGFGVSPDGSVLGSDDFATEGPVSFGVPIPDGTNLVEFQAEAELGADRNAVVRVVVADRAEGSPGGRKQRALIADPKSLGYKAFRTGIAEYASLLPPNSHGEANPADKDPIPQPFDNTYNGDEHDAFILKVKYQRADDFFARNLVDGAARARLDQAWNDLFGSWPYHDAYLGMLIDHYGLTLKSRRMQDMDAAAMAALPAELRQYVVPLRAHYDEVTKAQKLAQPGHVEDALAFASRAWRRPLTIAEKAKLREFYQKARTTLSLDHQDAIRAVLARILMSPAFLYRTETVASGPEKPLSGSEIASRLSFFLWSSVPDDELRRAAVAGELASPPKLAAQVKRMMADPKARRFATEFFGQWLGFYAFDRYTGVDSGRFPEFTEDVKSAMYDEAISTFEYIVRNDRPAMEFLDADYTFLNKALVKFYGLKVDLKSSAAAVPADADGMVKVEGAKAFNRGGALRLGSILTSTSAPLRTSPVKRGDWVLRRLLGTPTPPPPADAGTLPADDHAFEGMTLRQKLTQHKRNATCAACHLRIDPLGFPLEGFDAVGRTRSVYLDGKAVDDTGEFADKSTLVGAAGLVDYLRSQNTQVMKTLSKKMIGYALGRTVRASDQALIDDMVRAGGSSSFSDLVVKVVTSRQFRNHLGEADGPARMTTGSKIAARESPLKEGVR
jgi:hypothetical protein